MEPRSSAGTGRSDLFPGHAQRLALARARFSDDLLEQLNRYDFHEAEKVVWATVLKTRLDAFAPGGQLAGLKGMADSLGVSVETVEDALAEHAVLAQTAGRPVASWVLDIPGSDQELWLTLRWVDLRYVFFRELYRARVRHHDGNADGVARSLFPYVAPEARAEVLRRELAKFLEDEDVSLVEQPDGAVGVARPRAGLDARVVVVVVVLTAIAAHFAWTTRPAGVVVVAVALLLGALKWWVDRQMSRGSR